MNAQSSTGYQDMVHRLLQAAGAQPSAAPTAEETDAPPFDWSRPNRYRADQLARLEQFGRDLAVSLAEGLAGLLREDLDLQSSSVQLHYARPFRDAFEDGTHYVAPLATSDQAVAGALIVPAPVAGEWVGRLLGGTGTVGERDLSALEKDLLLDLVRSAAEAISAGLTAGGGTPVQPQGQVSSQRGALPGDEVGELCEFALEFVGETPTPALSCLLACDLLDATAGVQTPAQSSAPQQIRQRLEGHLAHVPLHASLRLGRAGLSLRDVMALEAGDVIVLDCRVDRPGDMVVCDKVLMQANAVQCKNRYAAQIVGWSSTRPSDQDPASAD